MYPLTNKIKKTKLFPLFLPLIAAILLSSCSAADQGEPEDITPDTNNIETLPPNDNTSADESDPVSVSEKDDTETIATFSDSSTEEESTESPETTFTETTTASPDTEASTSEPETTQPETAIPIKEKAPDPNKLSHTEAASNKIAFLTFDDGPNKANNERILEILEEYGVKATFFTVGQQVECYPDGLRATYEKGHAIGCHSYDHDYARVKTDITSEIEDWEKAVEKALGEAVPAQLFRFPGGSPTKDENKLKDKVAKLGYNGYDWNCLNNDCLIKKCPADMEPVEWMKQSFANTYKYGSSLKHSPLIILMHETYSETADMLAWAIEFLQEEGYTFGTLDQLSDSWYY